MFRSSLRSLSWSLSRLSRAPVVAVVALALAAVSCAPRPTLVYIDPPRPVSIEVQVYDPISGGVWQDVGVRIVQAEQEWSGCLCRSPFVDSFVLTDSSGFAYFSPLDLASYDVGFALDSRGRAVLAPGQFEDEARVLLEVWAPGFASVFVSVDLFWSQPSISIAVPFD
ncbi:MAG: hypothetical protein AB7I19_17550 [Planctomycetota bacterium]